MRLIASFLFALVTLVSAATAADLRVPASPAEIRLSFAPVVKQTARAVVNIYAKRVVSERVSPFADDPFFSQFFGLQRSVPRVQNSLGSGVILTPDGIVVSNHHVVGDAAEIRVILPDRREFDAEVLMSDAEADLAVLKLRDAEGLPALEYGDADAVEVGDLVLAIGNPFGVGQTVSSGIVSGLARTTAGMGERYFIQTDAPINPGNSGGALVDMAGRLIGINSSILTRSGGSNGIGFAIPVNLVRQYVEQAVEGRGAFVRPWSGMRVQTVEGDLAAAMGQSVPEGVLVREMHRDSPFRDAGLETGDIITGLNGLGVNAPAELEYRLAALGPGGEAEVEFLRDGRPLTGRVPLIEAPGGPVEPLRVEAQTLFSGLVLADLTPRLIDELHLPLDAEGVIVLETGGYAVRSGLRPGDVLVAVDGEPVTRAADAGRMFSAQRSHREIDAVRDGRRIRLQLRG